MKRILLLTILVLVLSVGPVFGAVGEPDANGKYPETDGKYSVVYNGGTAGNQYVILVLSSDLTAPPATGPSSMPSVSVDSIKYIDQAAADGQGKVTFENFIPMDRTKYNLVYISGQGMDVPKYVGYMDKAAGVSVSGNVTYLSGKAGRLATVRLLKDTNEIDSVMTDQNGLFTLESVPNDTYSIEATAESHLSHIVRNVGVIDTDLSNINIPLIAGNVNGDGTINFFDLSIILDNFNKTSSTAINKAADIDGDSIINFYDLNIILDNYNKTSTVSDF